MLRKLRVSTRILGMLITLVVNGRDRKGRIISYVDKWENGRFVHMARRLAKSFSAEAPGNWAEVICGDYEWYEHYRGGSLLQENSKLKGSAQ